MASLLEAVRVNNTRLVDVYLTVPQALAPRELHLALFLAARLGHVDVLQALLLAGAEMGVGEARDNNNNTALYVAVANNRPEAVRVLASTASGTINTAGGARNMPVHEAARLGHVECLRVLLEHGTTPNARDTQGATPLILAVMHKRYTTVTALLKAGCAVDVQDNPGRTALHYACQHGHNATAVPLLLAHGVHLNLQDNDGCTPLFVAASEGLSHVVRALVSTGRCDVNLATHGTRRTPLHLLAYKGHADCLLDMIAAGADINLRDVEGRTALWHAVNNGRVEVIKLLLKANNQAHNFRCSTHLPTTSTLSSAGRAGHGGQVEVCPVRLALDKGLVAVVKLFILTGYDNKHLRECLTQPDAIQLFTQAGLQHWLHHASDVMSLRSTCRKWIRDHLGRHLCQQVTHLPLPPALRDFLFLAELDEHHD